MNELNGTVISTNNRRTVVLLLGEDEKILIIRDKLNNSELTAADRLHQYPVGTVLSEINFDPATTEDSNIFKKVSGIIKSCNIVTAPTITERIVICTKNQLCHLTVADVKDNTLKNVQKTSRSHGSAYAQGSIFKMKTVEIADGFFDQSTNSYFPLGTTKTPKMQVIESPEDVIVDLQYAKGYDKLILSKDDRENWKKLSEMIMAVDAVIIANAKDERRKAKICGEMEDAEIQNETDLLFSIKNKNSSNTNVQKNFYRRKNCASINIKGKDAIKLTVVDSSFTSEEAEITFKTNYANFKEHYPNDDLNGTQLEIVPNLFVNTFSSFSKKIQDETLPVWTETATNESKEILSSLFGLCSSMPKPLENDETFESLKSRTTEDQLLAIKHAVENTSAVGSMEAPPGCGKTYTNCLIIEELISQSKNLPILVITKSSVPGYYIAAKLQEKYSDILMLSAKSETKNLNSDEKWLLQKFGLGAHIDNILRDWKLDETQKQLYLDAQEMIFNEENSTTDENDSFLDSDDNLEKHKKIVEVLNSVIALKQPKVIISTLKISSKIVECLTKVIQYCIVDEAEKVPVLRLASVVSELPKLKGILLIGDSKQLDGFEMSMPRFMKNYGYSSALAAINKCQGRGVVKTFLRETFRFPLEMVPLLSECCYDGKLVAGKKDPSNDILFEVLGKKFPYQFCFIDLPGEEVECFPRSRTNKAQGYEAVDVANKLKKKFPDKSVFIASFYGKQNELIKERAKTLKIKTLEFGCVDSAVFQEEEKDFVILNLTISKDSNNRFINDPGRFTASVTRARLACVIIGNFNLMKEYSSWEQLCKMLGSAGSVIGRFESSFPRPPQAKIPRLC